MKEALVVNLLAGPGAFKSGTAAGIFTLLKLHGVDCELPYEFPKDMVWEESTSMMRDQAYILGNQNHRVWRLKDKVDVIVTDSSILFSLVYRSDDLGDKFTEHVVDLFSKYNNFNILLERNPSVEYVENGRNESYEEAIEVDRKVKEVVETYCDTYYTFTAGCNTINDITKSILNILGMEIKYKLEKTNE